MTTCLALQSCCPCDHNPCTPEKPTIKFSKTSATPKSRKVYLPAGATLFDFWTGEKLNGGQEITREAPIDLIPLYVKAGSILPWGPKVQYATEKRWDDLEIRIYPGADADFTLYEDENDNYNYEKGMYSEIAFHWNDAAKTLTVKDRKGEFPGMLKNRKFKLVVVKENSGVGIEDSKSQKTVRYSGKEIVTHLQ